MKRARKKVHEHKKTSKARIFAAAFCIIAVAFVLVLGFNSVLFPMNDEYTEPVDKASGKVNVLVLGVDADGLRTDTIILASYDLDNNKINMLSIPRDTRMYIGKKYQKINAAHSLTQNGKIKGPQGTIEAVTRLTGVPINYYVEFSTSAFRKMIDALGGVEFDVPQRMHYTDSSQGLYIDLQPGVQILDGDKAEQLVRFRKYPRGDIARVEVQQSFVKAVAEQKLNVEILTKLPDIYEVLQSDIKTNFTVLDIMKYVPNLKELTSENVQFFQLPGEFSGAGYSASYWLADIESLKTLITDTFGYDATYITTGIAGKQYSGEDRIKSSPAPTADTTPKPTSAPRSTPKPSPDAELPEDDYIAIPNLPEPTEASTATDKAEKELPTDTEAKEEPSESDEE